jgi:hypothetical protein
MSMIMSDENRSLPMHTPHILSTLKRQPATRSRFWHNVVRFFVDFAKALQSYKRPPHA